MNTLSNPINASLYKYTQLIYGVGHETLAHLNVTEKLIYIKLLETLHALKHGKLLPEQNAFKIKSLVP
jgi:hypothetical protein